MATCRRTPMVKTLQGEVVPSQLHQDLSVVVKDKAVADNLWDIAHKGVKAQDGTELDTDLNGEVKFDELLGKTDAGNLLTDEQIAEGLNDLHQEDPVQTGLEGAKTTARKSVEFNDKSALASRAVAIVVVDENKNSRIVYEPLSVEAAQKAEETKNNMTLQGKLERWLNERGVSVGVLTEAEEGAGIDGVTDFSVARNVTEGMREIVRVAKGEKGQAAITEEAAHVAVMMLRNEDEGVRRALRTLENNEELMKEVLGGQYEMYHDRYKGDVTKLAHEAAGHLLRDALSGEYNEMARPQASRFSNLWHRLKDAVLNFFRKFSMNDLDRLLSETKDGLRGTARKILDDECYKELDFSDIADGVEELFALSKKVNDELKRISEQAIVDNKTRMKKTPAFMNAKRKDGKKRRYDYLKELGVEMKDNYTKGDYVASVVAFLSNASKDLAYQLISFRSRYNKASAQNRAYIINNIEDMCLVYHQVVKDVQIVIEQMEEEAGSDPEVKQQFELLKSVVYGSEKSMGLNSLIVRCEAKIHNFKMPTFIEGIKRYGVPIDNIVVPNGGRAYGLNGGETVSLEDQMNSSPEIGRIDQWLLPAAFSNSMPIQVFQNVKNRAELEIRDKVLEYTKRLKELTLQLEQAGYSNQEWMFERDEEGKLTGKYIKLDSDAYRQLSDAQKTYYNGIMEIKRELDSLLPFGLQELLNAPKIRKDFLEQLKRQDKAAYKTIKDYMSELWSVKSDDEYVLQNDKMLVDYNNKQVKVVPIRFLQFAENEDSQNLSMDITSTMSIYAKMCCNYSIMTRVAPLLELGRSILNEGYSSSEKRVKDEDGNITTETINGTKRGEHYGDRTMSRINDILDDVYGFKAEDLTFEVGGASISITKIGQRLMALTAMNQYMMSVNAAVQNAITAQIQFLGESVGRKYYNGQDVMWAQSIFASNLPQFLSDAVSRVETGKLSLFNERFNVRMNDEENRFNRKGASRLAQMKNGYFMTTTGEAYANTVIALATAHRTKLKDKDGNEINLYDAMEVVDMATKKLRDAKKLRAEMKIIEAEKIEQQVSEHPEWTNSTNKYLVMKEGVMKMDGTEFTDNDIHEFSRKVMHVSHMLNGVYNIEDAAKWQRYIGGQMIGMYRKWIATAWYRRLNGLNYSLDDKEWSEGFYRTFFRITYTRTRALFDKTLAANIKGQKLTDMEKANLRRATLEIGMWLCAIGLKILLGSFKDKKKRDSFAWNTMYYYVVRTQSELNSMVPLGMTVEAARIAQNPAAALSTVNNFMGLVGCLFNPLAWSTEKEDLIQSGKYKGMTKLERSILKSPFLPGSHQWLAFWYPEDSVRFYE